MEQNSPTFSNLTELEAETLKSSIKGLSLLHGMEYPDQIEPGLYIGSVQSVSNLRMLQQDLQVTHILVIFYFA